MEQNKLVKLSALAERQHGQFSVWQAREVGLSDTALSRAVARGELVRVRNRVYRFAGVPSTWIAELHADTLCTPRMALASHSAALRLHAVRQEILPYNREILTLGTGLVEVDPEVTVHRTRRLDEKDVTEVMQTGCTSLPRTLVDVTPGLPWWKAVDLTDRALCGAPGLRAAVHHTAKRLHLGRPGVDRLVKMTADGAEAEFWSWLEREASPLVVQGGLHDAAWNVRIPGVGRAGIVDTYSADRRLVIEWKGLAFHRRPNELQRDSDKQNACAAAGLIVLSFTWLDVVERPPYVVATIRTAARRAAA